MSFLSSLFNVLKSYRLKVGDRISLFGGYSTIPEWLQGKKSCYGEVINFVPGPYEKNDAVVKLDEEISYGGIKGNIMVLTLRYKKAKWGRTEIVHLHLFEDVPFENKWSTDRDSWNKNHIESHASYKKQMNAF
ncbi:MAG: hypothetical protein PHC58_06730 [Candidatus Omnitrophica bacterium]|nr:hypothetical protein [Candidatus Omnitrophota bacterium]